MDLDLRYPIGKFTWPAEISPDELRAAIVEIAATPAKLRAAVAGWSAARLDTPYRPDGWTARQVVHHVADSHLNCYARYRLALTEDEPIIKPYDEKRWGELADAAHAPLEPSFQLLEGLHLRWVMLVETLTPEQWARTFRHPERPVPMRLDVTAALYAWHGRHHVAHITELARRNGW